MKTTEETYIEYICSNCKNRKLNLCEIRTKIDNTTYCKNYIKDKEVSGYKKPLQRTANLGHCVMPNLISDWSRV